MLRKLGLSATYDQGGMSYKAWNGNLSAALVGSILVFRKRT